MLIRSASNISNRLLGHSGIEISPVGLGCWQFSEGKGMGRYWPDLSQQMVNDIVAVSLAGGVNWFDTAEAYGGGRSEAALASALTAAGKQIGDVAIATKWWPMLRSAQSIKTSFRTRRS